MRKVDYRPEIDGLRALAVMAVMLFHGGIPGFSGGFVGVDVFFVISGFLITGILLKEIERDQFKFSDFYERRIRRIIPAQFFVLSLTFPLAWFWLSPPDMESYSGSLIAVSTFSSNFYFWFETGYWGTTNELKPLLHTWSLAVEEQYYLLFPPLLLLAARLPKLSLYLVLIAISVASLLAAQWASSNMPSANFFLLPFRAWELGIGAILALVMFRSPRYLDRSLGTRNMLSIMGFLLILYSIAFYDENTPFPGISGLVPTIGTALIIAFGISETLVGRLFGSRVFVFVGLISYSAYLWHQPLFAFTRHRSIGEVGPSVIAMLIILSLVLAYISWRYVERPFRDKAATSRRTIFLVFAIGSLLFILVGVTGVLTNGFESRQSSAGISMKERTNSLLANHGLDPDCDGGMSVGALKCRTDDEPEILLWGDSFAMHLVQGILASNPEAKIIQMTKSACGPFFGIGPIALPKFGLDWSADCIEYNEQVYNWISASQSLKYVVISSPFHRYFWGKKQLLTKSGERIDTSAELGIELLQKTIEELKGLGVTPVIFSPMPTNDSNIGRCLDRASQLGAELRSCNFPAAEISPWLLNTYSVLESVSESAKVVRLDQILCEEGVCETHIGNTFLYRDSSHLSTAGSALLGEKVDFYQMIVSPAASWEPAID